MSHVSVRDKYACNLFYVLENGPIEVDKDLMYEKKLDYDD